METKISPLAPKEYAVLPPIEGVKIGCVEAGIKYRGRKDLMAMVFDKPAQLAGVFTKSKCSSAPVEWCREKLGNNTRCIVVNSGNANAFTGKKGGDAVAMTAQAAAQVFECHEDEVFLASTGVIGEPLEAAHFSDYLRETKKIADEDNWHDASLTIMTTDTYPKLATRSFSAQGTEFRINGIAKGSGMIAPDMATMLSFLVTDFPVSREILQRELRLGVANSFNAISVDSDTSTSDTVLLASTADETRLPIVIDNRNPSIRAFRKALREVLHDLAMDVVRDGEGATKQIAISVSGAHSSRSAKKIAMSVANSPLVKTAIAGEDANWGRIVMAIGKAGEPADRDKISIWFGELRVACDGERDDQYDEGQASKIMRDAFIPIHIELGIGNGRAKVWTCDLTHGYVDINADYRS